MSTTSTTRLGIVKPTPGTGEPVNLQTQINDSWDKIDSAIGATICTSSTRPASPFHGQFIRETDTRKLYVWNATQSAWDLVMDNEVFTDWANFTPTWSAVTTPPSIGNGSIVGRYKKIGRVVHITIRLTWGSSTSGGTGNWQFSSFPEDRAITNNILPAQCLDSSPTGIAYPATALLTASGTPSVTRIGAHSATGAIGSVSGTHPFSWGTGDVLILQGSYQSAS